MIRFLFLPLFFIPTFLLGQTIIGKYKGIHAHNTYTIEVNKDSTFVQRNIFCLDSYIASGHCSVISDTLVLEIKKIRILYSNGSRQIEDTSDIWFKRVRG